MLTPFERYHKALSTEGYLADATQAVVVDHFQELYNNIIEHQEQSKKWFRKPKAIKGLYIWGTVGVGKTWLMDMFYDSLPLKQKWRIHFHEFMQQIHDQLQRWQGRADPLQKIAEQYAKQYKILCFDEFFVSDIGDAMLLGNLFEALFKQNMIIVSTSNVPPDDLYKDGLQRGRFLPAISLIKKHMHVLAVKTTQDYRLRELEQAGVFFSEHNEEYHHHMKQLFQHLAQGKIHYHEVIWINHRPIKTLAYADNIVWFDFKQLCTEPRSQFDYLAIAKHYKTLFLSHVHQIKSQDINTAKYLINLIDVLYDLDITLVLSSTVPIEKIYLEGDLAFEFRRTRSRLLEMQSKAYLEKAQAEL